MKNVLVTGASGDIGGAIARAFAENGYCVAAQYNNNKIKNLSGIALALKADVSDYTGVCGMFDTIHKKIGSVDILINNAGIQMIKMLCDTTPAEWQKIIGVNLTGVYNCTKCALDDMMYSGGKIINISSVWGQCGGACESAYSATKAGVEGLTKSLAKEYSNININCIAPGVITSKMNSHLSEDELSELKEAIPLRRFGTPEDVAQTALFLASGGADYITGQIIAVNGGMYI